MVSLQWKEDYLLWHWRPGALINLWKRHTHTSLCVVLCVVWSFFFFFKPSVLPKGLDLAGIVGTFGNIVRSQHRAVMWWNLCPSSSNELLVFLPNSLFTLPRKPQVIVEEVLILLSLYFFIYFFVTLEISPRLLSGCLWLNILRHLLFFFFSYVCWTTRNAKLLESAHETLTVVPLVLVFTVSVGFFYFLFF